MFVPFITRVFWPLSAGLVFFAHSRRLQTVLTLGSRDGLVWKLERIAQGVPNAAGADAGLESSFCVFPLRFRLAFFR